jgi:phosphoglycolate phosphatase-like HAD superfamily hydrolase
MAETRRLYGPSGYKNQFTLGNPTPISRRSGKIPAIALDLDKTVYTNSPAMDAAESAAVFKGVIPFGNAKEMGFINFSEEMEFAAKTGFWKEWERLAITDIEPNQEMIKFLQRLQGSGISLNAMTARSQRVQEPTLRLLEKMGIIPNEVFFRPDTLIGENTNAAVMKVNWMNETSNKYNYVAMFDDSASNVKAALKSGVPAVLQPNAKGVDSPFLEGSIKRGLETMQEVLGQESTQYRRGVENISSLIDIASTKSGSRSARTFVGIAEAKSVAANVIKGVL